MTHNYPTKTVGGSYSDLRKLYQGTGETTEVHHIPAYSAYKDVASINKEQGACIVMDKQDHQKTASWGRSKQAQAYCHEQKNLIATGKIDAASKMDKADLKTKFGSKYRQGINQAESYLHQKVIPNLQTAPITKIPGKLDALKQSTPTNNQQFDRSLEQKLGSQKAGLSQRSNSPLPPNPSRGSSPTR